MLCSSNPFRKMYFQVDRNCPAGHEASGSRANSSASRPKLSPATLKARSRELFRPQSLSESHARLGWQLYGRLGWQLYGRLGWQLYGRLGWQLYGRLGWQLYGRLGWQLYGRLGWQLYCHPWNRRRCGGGSATATPTIYAVQTPRQRRIPLDQRPQRHRADQRRGPFRAIRGGQPVSHSHNQTQPLPHRLVAWDPNQSVVLVGVFVLIFRPEVRVDRPGQLPRAETTRPDDHLAPLGQPRLTAADHLVKTCRPIAGLDLCVAIRGLAHTSACLTSIPKLSAAGPLGCA